MSHTYRFSGQRLDGGQWSLGSRDEWHHLLNVLRLPIGTQFEISNSQGWVALVRLTSKGKYEGGFEVIEEVLHPSVPPERQITLALAAVKPQSVEDFLPSIIELGVDKIWIFSSENSDKLRVSEKVQERWARIISSSSKQAKRAWWPEISWLPDIHSVIQQSTHYPTRIVMDFDIGLELRDSVFEMGGPVISVIGSEKGLARSELAQLLENGFRPVKMSGFVLRSVTATIAGMALLRHYQSTVR